MEQVIPFTHQMLRWAVGPADTVIDATAGNGRDTVFLAGISAHVHAFDIQKDALDNTRKLLEDHGCVNATLHLKGHEHIDEVDIGPFKAAVFNLGYLPGGDKAITTKRDTSLTAVKKAVRSVQEEGLVSITVYPGHPEGKEEAAVMERFLTTLDTKRFSVLKYQFINTTDAPYSLMIKKNRKD